MNRVFGIRRGALQRKTVFLVLIMLAAVIAVFMALSQYQNKSLVQIVGDTRIEQQQSISQVSGETMRQIVKNTMENTTELQANVADNDFSEVQNYTHMLGTLTREVFENKDALQQGQIGLPDPANNGVASAMVLFEEGVDYTQSEYLGYAANLAAPMIAMLDNSEKIDGIYIGFADGTDLCVDEKPLLKLDEKGEPIPFPVRERPWYVGAVEAGDIYFTGIMADAFSGDLVITCSSPVSARGEFIGVVGIDVILESMGDFMRASQESDGTVFVVNEHGQVILSSEKDGLFSATATEEAPDLRTLGNEELARFVDLALSEKTELNVINIDGTDYYIAGAPMPTIGWAVISIIDKTTTELPEKTMLSDYDRINAEASAKFRESSARTQHSGRLIMILVIFFSLSAAVIAAGRIVRPLEQMTENIIESGKTGQLFEMKDSYRTHDEIEVLAEAFDDLSKKTRQYIEDITEITKEKERVNTELNMANQIQSSMLPHIFPAFPNRHELDIYATMDPAREVGGDFYDFFLVDENHLALVIADVSGKGVPGALFMMVSKAILKNTAMMGKSPGEILTATNEMICSNNKMQMFVTVWLGILEISTGKIVAANAGHEYPALSQGGAFALLKDKHNFIIGGMDGVRYKEYEIQMKPGDRLFLYTDGVPEATDTENRMFGTDRMLDALNAEPDVSPKRILENVRGSVDAFVKDSEQFDDLTMMCIEYNGP